MGIPGVHGHTESVFTRVVFFDLEVVFLSFEVIVAVSVSGVGRFPVIVVHVETYVLWGNGLN